MTKEKNTFYVTTPIYYVNAKPHLGSLYSTILADVAARWNKIKNSETFMLTGTDEHGQKVAQAAEKAGKNPQEFVDSLVDSFKDLWHRYEIDFNHFIRTTDPYHVTAVQDWLTRLQEQGDIYKAAYEGWYCTSSEAFLTDKDCEFKTEGEPPISLLSGKPAVWVSEECYFFRLSAYQDRLLELYKNNPDFITPAERRHEVIAFVESGLKDLSISRKTITWGIPFPGDEQHVTYVWADALNNYLTAIGYGDKTRKDEFEKWWPADLQIMGKDIVRFHAVYWPAFLMASGLALPKKLLVHGWIKCDGQKMSKSLGNVVDPVVLAESYGVEPVRYYLTRYMAVTQDSPFGTQDLEDKVNADLVGALGNLLNRMLSLALKNDVKIIESPEVWAKEDIELHDGFQAMLNEFEHHMQDYYFHRAYSQVWKFINAVNAYFHAQEPWKLAKTDRTRFAAVLSATCHSLYGIAYVLWPIMPTKMEELLAALGTPFELGVDYATAFRSYDWKQRFVLHETGPLFEKYETAQESGVQVQEEKKEQKDDFISIDDVARVQLVAGKILEVVDLPESEKIYQMRVDCGQHGIRTICAGVKKFYAPEDLIGKHSVFVVNLKPRKLLGVESQGMMMMATDVDGTPTVVMVDSHVAPGTRLK